MTNRRLLVLAGPSVLLLAACGGSSGNASSDSPQTTVTVTASASPSTNSAVESQQAPSTAPSTSAPASAAPSTSAAPTNTSAAPTTPAAPVSTVTVTGQKTYVIKIWAQDDITHCQNDAEGTAIVNFLIKHPCRSAHRVLATTTIGGREVGMSVITVGFIGGQDAYTTAGDYSDLVSKDGTGAIKSLFDEGYRLPSGPTSLPDPDAFTAIGQDDGVSTFDMWYLSGSTPANDPVLVNAARTDLFLHV